MDEALPQAFGRSFAVPTERGLRTGPGPWQQGVEGSRRQGTAAPQLTEVLEEDAVLGLAVGYGPSDVPSAPGSSGTSPRYWMVSTGESISSVPATRAT